MFRMSADAGLRLACGGALVLLCSVLSKLLGASSASVENRDNNRIAQASSECQVHAAFFPFLWAPLYTCYLSRTSLSDLDVSRGQGSVGSQKRKKIASHYITCPSSSWQPAGEAT